MRTLDLSIPMNRFEGPSFTLEQWATIALVVLYVAISFAFFFAYVNPSLKGDNSLRIGADSNTYLWIAGVGPAPQSLNPEDVPDTHHLILSIGNFLGPLLIAVVFRNNFLIACFNYFLFLLAFNFLRKIEGVEWAPLLLLLLIHPITFVSLLTLNKEVISLLGVSMLFYYLSRPKNSIGFFILILVVAFLARWEQCALTIYFLMVKRPALRRRRMLIFTLTAVAASIAYVVLARTLTARQELITGSSLQGNLILVLDELQLHYLYFIVFIPKALLNLYAGVMNPAAWVRADWHDLYNSFVFLFGGVINFLATAIYLFRYRRCTLQSNAILFIMYCALFMSIAPFTNSRYIFPVYVVLALMCSKRKGSAIGFPFEREIASSGRA